MHTLGEQLHERRLKLGLTLEDLAKAVGSTKSYLSMIENHRVANPPSTALLRALEAALQVTDGSLQRTGDWERAPAGVRDEVQRLSDDAKRGRALARFIRDSARSKEGIGKDLDGLYQSGQLRKMIDNALGTIEGATAPHNETVAIEHDDQTSYQVAQMPRVPLINKVAAGYPCGFTDLDYPARAADDYVSCPGLDDPDAFAAVVNGESMLPEYREGDIVVFSPAADVTDGCDCFVRLEPDHETTFKRVYFDEDGALVRLQPLNPKFAPAVHPREQVAGLYRAVWRYSRL